jgi:hypothetical protein
MLKNVPNLYRAAKHVDRSQTLAGQSLEPILALKNVEVPLGGELVSKLYLLKLSRSMDFRNSGSI